MHLDCWRLNGVINTLTEDKTTIYRWSKFGNKKNTLVSVRYRKKKLPNVLLMQLQSLHRL
jgi:hypothetical protein